MEAEQPSDRSLEETTALVHDVYKATWHDFYTWEQDHCLRTLHSLARTPSSSPPRSAEIKTRSLSNCDLSLEAAVVDKTTEEESFTLHDYSRDTPAISTLSAQTINVINPFKACPPYEICTPVSRNIYVGDDFEDMPFIQLVDDPTFDLAAHTADYKRFEWQLPNRDPDCKSSYT